jgi:hypothetical protein
MTGHVFVVPGSLESLDCDDVVVPTDHAVNVTDLWDGVLEWRNSTTRRRDLATISGLSNRERVGQLPERGLRRRWLLSVGNGGGDVELLIAGLEQCLRAVAASPPLRERVVRRVGLPTLGVAGGGYGGQRGKVIRKLLEAAHLLARELRLDIVFVAFNPADYAAFQAGRHLMASPLTTSEEEVASALADHARAGELALFMGAGTSMSAGLPSWGGLLRILARQVGTAFDEDLWRDLGPLDAAELLRRKAKDHGLDLGQLVREAIGPFTRYGLTHVQLAALGCEQAITTNFDRLYEDAKAAVDGHRPLVVLPGGTTRTLAGSRHSGWLLKLHGDIADPKSVVLARRSFVTFDASRRPLGGVLQATLLTKHLLVVGASMTDDNVIRLVHEVAELGERHHGAARLGTVVTLEKDQLRAELWKPEFDYVALGHRGDIRAAARRLEVFLDRVVLLAGTGHGHLVSQRYESLLPGRREREPLRWPDNSTPSRRSSPDPGGRRSRRLSSPSEQGPAARAGQPPIGRGPWSTRRRLYATPSETASSTVASVILTLR